MIKELSFDYRKFRDGAISPTSADANSYTTDWYAWTPENTKVAYGFTNTKREMIIIPAGERAKVLTGINVRVPRGYTFFACPRSGLAFKYGISLVNTPGLIDSSYDGDDEDFELAFLVINHDIRNEFVIHHGDKIAQIIAVETPRQIPNEVFAKNINRETDRIGGFGSSG